MRVHGDKVIRRRPGILQLKRYEDAKEFLQEDFCGICGYCGKDSRKMYQRFQIDHFVPRSLAPERETDYYNLVLACAKCNQIKSNQWPTQNISLPHDEENGFIDPATEEFDHHLARDADGYIIGLTPLGENICKRMHFDIRRTDLFWKIGKLCEQREKLEQLYDQGVLQEVEKNYKELEKSYEKQAEIKKLKFFWFHTIAAVIFLSTLQTANHHMTASATYPWLPASQVCLQDDAVLP